MSCKIANLWDNDLKFLTSILIILQKSSSCISRKQAVCAFFYFPYPWFTDQTKYVKYLFWSRASLWGLTSSKNLMFIRSVVSEILPPLEPPMTLWKSFKTLFVGTNHKCLSLLTWPTKSSAPPANQLTPLHWDELLVNKTLISKMGMFDPH